ncbi:BTAD domain-containing putative transcriptional regulator [Streptomyces sp. Ru87]|uniref:AfsR/SARP family transcriptional regulator n=2 Tax=unclassified Streptomyces TaxID=2593676 RepID=UPI00117DA21B|nr:BTAD domain-containing putative transcriptional regulator [Streptomyces sp. Ru87]
MLGQLEAWAGDEAVDLGPARQRLVAAVLLWEAGQVVPSERLIDRVWGDSPPGSVRNLLYGYIGKLRAALRNADDTGGAEVTRASGGYRLRVDPDRVDVHRFRRLVDEARALAGEDDERAAAVLSRALRLWPEQEQGLAGLRGTWVEGVRARLESERLAASLDHHEIALRLGRHREHVTQLRRLAAAHPLDERLAGMVMTALHRCGRQAEALAHFGAVRRSLAEELGVGPCPELRAVHRRILRGEPEPGPGSGAGTAPAVPRAVPAELPHDCPDFTGRSEAVARLDTLLLGRDGPGGDVPGEGATICAIVGTAGSGKTALAVHWSHRVRDRFPDGQLAMDLRGFDHERAPLSRGEALSHLLRSLGVEPTAIPVDEDAQARLYRSLLADRRVLLLLDNAASAEQVRPLLPGARRCRVLVTSRHRLGGLVAVDHAQPLPLDPLDPGEGLALLTSVVGGRRVADEPEAAGELVRRCGRLPLAIRVAAAQLAYDPGLGIAELAAELADDGDRLGALELAGDRPSAVRATFDLSYRALADEERRLFRLLGLVPGPDVTPAAVAALSGSDERTATRLLRALAAAHLVGSPAPGRHRLHDLLRDFARERAAAELPPAERKAALRRLLAFYRAGAEAATAFGYAPLTPAPRADEEDDGPPPVIPRIDGHDAAVAWLESERENLVAAVVRAADTGLHEPAWRLTYAVRQYFYDRQHLSDLETAAMAGMRAAERAGDPLGRAFMHAGIGGVHRFRMDLGAALDSFRAALDAFREASFVAGEPGMMNNIGIVYNDLGDLRRSGEWLTRAVALLRTLDRPEPLANTLSNLSDITTLLGELPRSVALATEAIELCEAMEQPAGLPVPLINRATAYRYLGREDEALADATRAAELSRRLGLYSDESIAQDELARLHRDAGRVELAFEHAERALRTAREWNRPMEANCLTTLGDLHRLTGRPRQAGAVLDQALSLAASRNPPKRPEVHLALARLHHGSGDREAAFGHARDALHSARELGLRLVECLALFALAEFGRAAGRQPEAAAYAAEAERIRDETGYRPSAPPPLEGAAGRRCAG